MINKKKLTIAYHNTFLSPDGKMVLQDLRRQCGAFDNPIITDNGIKMALQSGEANVIKYIYKKLLQDPYDERPNVARNRMNIDNTQEKNDA